MASKEFRITRPEAAAVLARDCAQCTGGWVTITNEATPDGAAVARWIRGLGLSFTESRATAAAVLGDGYVTPGQADAQTDPQAPVTVFRFAPGQPCFSHARSGPLRFYAGQREHASASDWGEDLAEHWAKWQEQMEKG